MSSLKNRCLTPEIFFAIDIKKTIYISLSAFKYVLNWKVLRKVFNWKTLIKSLYSDNDI